MRKEVEIVLNNKREVDELDALICDIRRFNGRCPEPEVKEKASVIPKKVSKEIDRVGWLRSILLTLGGLTSSQ